MRLTTLAFAFAFVSPSILAEEIDTSRGDQMLANYFSRETEKLTDRILDDVRSLEDWNAKRDGLRIQLFDMLGLQPLPDRTDLHAVVTRQLEHDDFTVKMLHFQSRPGLYVTANLYVPKSTDKPVPAVLYVCGHGRVAKNGVSYGNKVHYHHHGCWFARNGYACLIIDSLQLGEIEGIHHGTYRENMWWWLNRGYTPAGVEAWNCIRAIDYLQTLPNVDPERIGVTGRSGGGVYSWWVAALDDRIKCAVPVAGITDLRNYVVDGVVEGHCDCMFMCNTYRWEYPAVAALVAPRPLLISNTDRDSIFPLDGVYRTYTKVRRLYELHDAGDDIALHITAGPHKDTQELRIHAFRWFNHYLKNDDSLITLAADKYFEPEQLKVFDQLPDDQRNTTIHETFVPVALPQLPTGKDHWNEMTSNWMSALRTQTFAAWPELDTPPKLEFCFEAENDGMSLRAFDFASQEGVNLQMYVLSAAQSDPPATVEFFPLDQLGWNEFVAATRHLFPNQLNSVPVTSVGDKDDAESRETDIRLIAGIHAKVINGNISMVFVAPRGIGTTIWNQSERKQIQNRRRFYLLGQTLDGMRVLDRKSVV